jgi:hypothetical protein
MPVYYFNLKSSQDVYVDPDGTELQDTASAFEHAQMVASELMQHREVKTRSWQLQVCDAERNILCELLFATVDHSMNAYPPALRNSVEQVCAKTAELNDVLRDVRSSIFQLKETIARGERTSSL